MQAEGAHSQGLPRGQDKSFQRDPSKKLVSGGAQQPAPPILEWKNGQWIKKFVVDEKTVCAVMINSVSPLSSPVVTVRVGEYLFPMMVDCGADVSILAHRLLFLTGSTLYPTEVLLTSASGHQLPVVGQATVTFTLGGQEHQQFHHSMAIVQSPSTSYYGMLGTDFLHAYAAQVDIRGAQLNFTWGSVPIYPRASAAGLIRLPGTEGVEATGGAHDLKKSDKEETQPARRVPPETRTERQFAAVLQVAPPSEKPYEVEDVGEDSEDEDIRRGGRLKQPPDISVFQNQWKEWSPGVPEQANVARVTITELPDTSTQEDFREGVSCLRAPAVDHLQKGKEDLRDTRLPRDGSQREHREGASSPVKRSQTTWEWSPRRVKGLSQSI